MKERQSTWQFEITYQDLDYEFSFGLLRLRMFKNQDRYEIWADNSDDEDADAGPSLYGGARRCRTKAIHMETRIRDWKNMLKIRKQLGKGRGRIQTRTA